MPAVILINPKYDHNVGTSLRACSCWGIPTLRWTGHRVDFSDRSQRIPREERMKGYAKIDWLQTDRPLDGLSGIPVAVEVRPQAECLTTFDHPEDAVYIFGPEDGSIPRPYLGHCHRFIFIPTHHCLNLSAAVNVVLAHRRFYRQLSGIEAVPTLNEILQESRGPHLTPALDAVGWDGK